MVKNVGKVDRSFRFLIGYFLLLTGLWMLDGLHGDYLGVSIGIFALIPFYTAITMHCFFFSWLRWHSLSKGELQNCGDPYDEK